MDASVVSSGKTAEKRSGMADHMSVSAGETTHKLSSPPEHPRVTRLRHRRLIAFLRDQGFHDSYKELTNKTRAHMSVSHLRRLVQRARWMEALIYLDRYLPPLTSPNNSFRAKVLRQFLEMHHRFANAVDGIVDWSVARNYLHLNNGRAVSHADLRLRSISFPILALEQVSLWCRRRYVKKKQTGQPEAIVRALKSQKLMVPSIGSVEEVKELVADLLDETLRDGVKLITYGLFRPLQPGGTGTQGAQFCKPMFGTSREAKSSRTLANAGAQFCQPMSGTSTKAKTSGTLANAGVQFCKPMIGTSTEAKTSGTLSNAGAQFCQPMFGTSAEAKTSGTLANAGTNQQVAEAGCHTNTARQDFDGRRNSELERQLKRQRTEKFGEASPAVSGPVAVVNLGATVRGVSSG